MDSGEEVFAVLSYPLPFELVNDPVIRIEGFLCDQGIW